MTAAAILTQTIASTKDLKFAKIKSYSGKPDDFQRYQKSRWLFEVAIFH